MVNKQPNGFDMIAVERNCKKMLESSDDVDGNYIASRKMNRQGGDLREDFDFIKVPKTEKPQL